MTDTGLTEQAGEQGDEDEANQGDAASRHQLFHALGLSAGVIVAITFEQVDEAPDAKAGTDSDNEGLENINGRVKEIHNIVAGINLKIVKLNL